MPSVDDVFQKQFAYIEELIGLGQFKEAYNVCKEILRIDPLNSKAKKYLSLVTELIKEHNERFVSEKIKEIEAIKLSGRLADAINEAEKLVQMFSDNEKAVSYMADLQKEYRNKKINEQGSVYKNYEKQIDDFISSGKLDEALKFCGKILLENPADKVVAAICREGRGKAVEAKLKSMKELFKTDKYEEILNALYALKKIEETTEVKNLIIKYTDKLRERQIDEKQDFIIKAKEDITYSFQMKKYNECVNAAQELLRINPKDKFAKDMVEKSQEKIEKQAKNDVFKQMDQAM